MNGTGFPTLAVRTAVNPSDPGSCTPSASTIRSPGCRPARAAGEGEPFASVGVTLTTSKAIVRSPTKASKQVKISAATMKWDSGPAAMTIARCQIGLAPYARSSSPGGMSFTNGFIPAIFT